MFGLSARVFFFFHVIENRKHLPTPSRAARNMSPRLPGKRTRACAIMGRHHRVTIYYAPFDHHLNANSLITPGTNCYVLVRSFVSRRPRANFRSVFQSSRDRRRLPSVRSDVLQSLAEEILARGEDHAGEEKIEFRRLFVIRHEGR